MIIDGKAIADQILTEIKETINIIDGRKPCLAVILVGNHPASKIYVDRKTKACSLVGIEFIKKHHPDHISEQKLLQEIQKFNQDPFVDGILVQLPLPQHINSTTVTRFINPEKDVDGFHPINVGKLLIGETDGFIPCTPLGIKVLLERTGISLSRKHVVVMGRSNIVGKPMAALLMQNTPEMNATVTVIHRASEQHKYLCSFADILISAIGQPKFVTADMVKEGAVVVDVGINKVENPYSKSGYEIVGDADFENIKSKCSYITPVPGGVGPMTIAMLLKNTLSSFLKRQHNDTDLVIY